MSGKHSPLTSHRSAPFQSLTNGTRSDSRTRSIESPQTKNKLHVQNYIKNLSSCIQPYTKSPKRASFSGNSINERLSTPKRNTEIIKHQDNTKALNQSSYSPLSHTQKSHQTMTLYDSSPKKEEYNSQPQSSRRSAQVPTTEKTHNSNSKAPREMSIESMSRRKDLTLDMRIKLGSYMILKVIMDAGKRKAIRQMFESAGLRSLMQKQAKMYKSGYALESERAQQAPMSERKVKPSQVYEYQEEENQTQPSQSYREKSLTSRDHPRGTPEKKLMDILKTDVGRDSKRVSTQVSSQNHSYSKHQDSELTESSLANQSGIISKHLSGRKERNYDRVVDPETPKKGGRSSADLKLERTKRKFEGAAVVIQRAVRAFLKRIRSYNKKIMNSNKKISNDTSRDSDRYTKIRVDPEIEALVEQLRGELDLSKKKTVYLQKENDRLVSELKKTEKMIQKAVNEKLTIERARIKDTLNEYSTFIDKLLDEKKALEKKNEEQDQLITELCARIETHSAENSKIAELEFRLNETEMQRQAMQSQYEALKGDSRAIFDERNSISADHYYDIVEEKNQLQEKLVSLESKLHELEGKLNSYNNRREPKEASSQSSYRTLEKMNSPRDEPLSSRTLLEDRTSPNEKSQEASDKIRGEAQVRTFRGSFCEVEESSLLEESRNINTAEKRIGPESMTKNLKSNSQTQLKSIADEIVKNTYSSLKSNVQHPSKTSDLKTSNKQPASIDSENKTKKENTPKKDGHYYSAEKKKKPNTNLIEKDYRSVRISDPLEFSFEASNIPAPIDSDFMEPFKLSVSLPEDLVKNSNGSGRSKTSKGGDLYKSVVVSSEVENLRNKSKKSDQLSKSTIGSQSARGELNRANKEDSDGKMNDLIQNLNKRLQNDSGPSDTKSDPFTERSSRTAKTSSSKDTPSTIDDQNLQTMFRNFILKK